MPGETVVSVPGIWGMRRKRVRTRDIDRDRRDVDRDRDVDNRESFIFILS